MIPLKDFFTYFLLFQTWHKYSPKKFLAVYDIPIQLGGKNLQGPFSKNKEGGILASVWATQPEKGFFPFATSSKGKPKGRVCPARATFVDVALRFFRFFLVCVFHLFAWAFCMFWYLSWTNYGQTIQSLVDGFTELLNLKKPKKYIYKIKNK